MPEIIQNILGPEAYQYFPIIIALVTGAMLIVPVLIYTINLRKTRGQLQPGRAPGPAAGASAAAPEAESAAQTGSLEPAGSSDAPDAGEATSGLPEDAAPIQEFKSPLVPNKTEEAGADRVEESTLESEALEKAAREDIDHLLEDESEQDESEQDESEQGEAKLPALNSGDLPPDDIGEEPAFEEPAITSTPQVESTPAQPVAVESSGTSADTTTAEPGPVAAAVASTAESSPPMGVVSSDDDHFDVAIYSSEELVIYDEWGEGEEEGPRVEIINHQDPAMHRLPVSGQIEGSGYSLEETVIYDDWEDADLNVTVETDTAPAAASPAEPAPAQSEAPADEIEREAGSGSAAAAEEMEPVALDPYPDVELPDEEVEVLAEPIPRLHEIDLSADEKFHEHQYHYFLDQFQANIADWTHDRPRVGLAFLPGPDDVLERNVMPQVFWKPAALHDDRRYRLADRIMPELYFHAMRKSHFMPVTDADDRTIYMHLVNYALWRDRADWIMNLAAFFDENRVPGDDLYLLAACMARVSGEENLAAYYLDRANDKNKPLHAAYHLLAGDDRAVREMIKQPGLDDGDFAWLGWLYAGYTGDHRGERKVMARMSGKDVVSVLDLFAALLMRGRLFLAGRLLLRHPLLGKHSDAALRAILQLYFRNGKYLLYLNRLEKSERWPGRAAWFEIYFCVHRLGGAGHQSATFRRLTAGKHYTDLPTPEEQEEFLAEMQEPRLRASRLEIQEIDYHHDVVNLAALLHETERIPVFRRSSQEAEQKRIRKVYAVVQYILEEDLPLDRLELYLRSMSGALLLKPAKIPEHLFKRLRALSGRNLIARMLVGLHYFERGNYHEAIDYLEICQMRHPLVMHRMAEMLLAERRLWEAEEAYRQILRFYPEEPIFWYNLGMILEKNGRPRGARQALERAVGLNPNFKAASTRLAKLKLQQPAIL